MLADLADLAVTLMWHADVLILQVAGVLDITTVTRFAAEIAAVLAACPPRTLVIDLCALDLLAAAGIRVLMDIVGDCAGKRIVTALACDPRTVVYRVMQMLRLHDRVAVFPSTQLAVAALAG